MQIVSIYPASSEARLPSFFRKACRASLQHDLSHTRTQSHILTKYTNLSVQPPKTPSPSSPAPTLTPYTLDRIQPTRPDSLHIFPSHKHPYDAHQHHPSQLFTSTPAHCHTRNKQNTSKTTQRNKKYFSSTQMA